MQFDQNNKIIQLCAKGIELEAKQPEESAALFTQAWNKATTNIEKFTAAHYMARHQTSIENKLKWDEAALQFALKIEDAGMLSNYPSLYLNIAKCHEDLGDVENAFKNYQTALSYQNNLPDDGYGKMITTGIKNGLSRIKNINDKK